MQGWCRTAACNLAKVRLMINSADVCGRLLFGLSPGQSRQTRARRNADPPKLPKAPFNGTAPNISLSNTQTTKLATIDAQKVNANPQQPVNTNISLSAVIPKPVGSIGAL
eukprot:4674529-Amphidinium_carterae.1